METIGLYESSAILLYLVCTTLPELLADRLCNISIFVCIISIFGLLATDEPIKSCHGGYRYNLVRVSYRIPVPFSWIRNDVTVARFHTFVQWSKLARQNNPSMHRCRGRKQTHIHAQGRQNLYFKQFLSCLYKETPRHSEVSSPCAQQDSLEGAESSWNRWVSPGHLRVHVFDWGAYNTLLTIVQASR